MTRDHKIILAFLSLAHGDYLAARHLLRAGFLEQGCALCATAVEKYLKAVIGVHGIAKSDHLGPPLFKLMKSCQPELFASLDEDFLKFLAKAYRLRYASVSSPGLSIVINQFRTLLAVDHMIRTLDQGFALKRGGEDLLTPYRQSVTASDQHLLEDNIALGILSMSEYFARPNRVLEIKIEGSSRISVGPNERFRVAAAGSWR
jgi:HEPN domain-containing protein